MKNRLVLVTLFALAVLQLGGCGYNAIQAQDENVQANWSEVQNQYQRRADLIPNLVNVVNAYANHEKSTLMEVTEARARVVQLSAESASDAQALAAYQKAQGDLGSALSRLMAITENYPQLKADANFRDLQVQLEGTENRVTVAPPCQYDLRHLPPVQLQSRR